MPFSAEQFLGVFELYNTAVYPAQIVLITLALIAIVLAVKERGGRTISLILGAFWAWMAIAYHLLFFASINPAAYLFAALFLVQAAIFLWLGAFRDAFRFAAGTDISGIAGWVMIAYALAVYPLLGYAFGHVYPRSPTFGAPCPTTIFTFALLLWQRGPLPFHVLAIPLLWSLIGFTAALSLGITEDIGLLVSGLVTVAILYLRRR